MRLHAKPGSHGTGTTGWYEADDKKAQFRYNIWGSRLNKGYTITFYDYTPSA